MVPVSFLLISIVFGILSVDDLNKTVSSPLRNNSDKVYVNPNGSLNLLHGYMSRENRQIHNKRLLSPGLKTNYSLIKEESKSTFTQNNTKDTPSIFDNGDSPTSLYLTEYYKSVKIMYNAMNGWSSIQTTQKESLYRFLTQMLGNEDRFKLLAAMLLVAEGVDLPLRINEAWIQYKKFERKIPVFICKREAKTEPLFEIKIYTIIKKRKTKDNEEELYKPKEILDLLRFFIAYGGNNKEKLDFYSLALDDTPSFLIRSYMFEFIQNLEEAWLFFKAVSDILDYTNNKKNSKIWKKFFTTTSNKVKALEPAYEALKTANRVVLRAGFPFSVYTPPPSKMQVNGYDRKNEVETRSSNLLFSDCCDITIYTLFCCLLYDPSVNEYRLDYMKMNGYTPSDDLNDFFERFLTRPEGDTLYHVHQRWTHVIQDLSLSKGELMGGEKSGENTIRYCKEENGVFAEVKTEILNVLRIVAKVTGMPKDRMKELGEICAIIESGREDVDDMKGIIERYANKIFNQLSVMNIDLRITKIEISSVNDTKDVHGNIEIKLRGMDDNKVSTFKYIVVFSLMKKHGNAEIIAGNNEIKEEDKRILEELTEKCDKIESELGRIVANNLRKFLRQGKFEPIPLKMIEEVEQAQNDIDRYSAINKILKMFRIVTTNEKLYLIDLFAPYLDRITRDSNMSGEKAVNNPVLDIGNTLLQNQQEGSIMNRTLIKNGNICELKPSNPVICTISNILGSVPLDDETTQYLFVQILAFCNGKHKYLFPSIHSEVNITPEFITFNVKANSILNCIPFRQLHKYNVPNILNRLYNKLRVLEMNLFYENIKTSRAMFTYSYLPMIEKCMLMNHTAGIKAAKEDFGIQKGRIMLGSSALSRFTKWLIIAVKTEYYKGLEEACDSWEDILKGEKNKIELMKGMGLEERCEKKRYELSRTTIDKLYLNERRIKALLEMHIYCAPACHDMDKAYGLFVSYFTTDLCNSLMTHLRSIVDEIYGYFLTLKSSSSNKYYWSTNTRLGEIKFCCSRLNELKCFVKKAVVFVKSHENFYIRLHIARTLAVIGNDISVFSLNVEKFKDYTEKEVALLLN
ncbi:hypothetical protein PAEPH01_0714 [Pancytospora epiphaga]|nr:hypothetical protein PAEPH01_0714 [Pancytospora epiphaga]